MASGYGNALMYGAMAINTLIAVKKPKSHRFFSLEAACVGNRAPPSGSVNMELNGYFFIASFGILF